MASPFPFSGFQQTSVHNVSQGISMLLEGNIPDSPNSVQLKSMRNDFCCLIVVLSIYHLPMFLEWSVLRLQWGGGV
jgi:hypothetical protein